MEVNVCVNETGICRPTIQAAINNATSGQTVVIINNTYEYNENVTVNVTGLTLTSNTSTMSVVWANSSQPTVNVTASNVVLKNLMVLYNGSTSNTYAVSLGSSNNFTVTGNVINSTASSGFNPAMGVLYSSNGSIVSNGIFTSGTGYGIYVTGRFNNISGNNVSSGGASSSAGVYIANSSNNVTSNNISIYGASSDNIGVFLGPSASQNRVRGNNITSRGSSSNKGVYLSGADQNSVENNLIVVIGTVVANDGIYFYNGATYNNISWNNISVTSGGCGTSGHGIFVGPDGLPSSFNNVSYNIIWELNGCSANSAIGLWGNNTNVSHNVILDGLYGISVSESSGTFVNNTINLPSAGAYGISIGGSGYDNNVLRANNVTVAGSTRGVLIAGGKNNVFYDTYISSPSSNDVYLQGTTPGDDSYFVNVTFNLTDIGVSAPSVQTKLFVQNRLDVTVRNASNVLDGALVFGNDTNSVDNAENPASNFSATTNSSGQAPTQVITRFMANGTYNSTSGYLYFNNYTITASKGGHVDNSTSVNPTTGMSVDILLRAMIYATTIFGRSTESFQIATDTDLGSVYAMVNSVNASGTLPSGWSHVAMTFESGTIKLYVNGRLAGTASTSATPAASNRSLMLGNGTDLVIDEVTFRSGVLSQGAIEQHWQVGPGLKAIVSAVGGGSFGRNFNISASTSDGSFSNRHITTADLLAGTTQSVNLPNTTGVPSAVVVTSNSCNQVLTATKAQLSGVYC